jgi:hypothetical protein
MIKKSKRRWKERHNKQNTVKSTYNERKKIQVLEGHSGQWNWVGVKDEKNEEHEVDLCFQRSTRLCD